MTEQEQAEWQRRLTAAVEKTLRRRAAPDQARTRRWPAMSDRTEAERYDVLAYGARLALLVADGDVAGFHAVLDEDPGKGAECLASLCWFLASQIVPDAGADGGRQAIVRLALLIDIEQAMALATTRPDETAGQGGGGEF